MNIEEVREYALSMNEQVTELLFADKWLALGVSEAEARGRRKTP